MPESNTPCFKPVTLDADDCERLHKLIAFIERLDIAGVFDRERNRGDLFTSEQFTEAFNALLDIQALITP